MSIARKGRVLPVCIPDEMAMFAGLKFAGEPWRHSSCLTDDNIVHLDEHKMLVELACSATLASAYSKETFNKIMDTLLPSKGVKDLTAVYIVCGGYKISLDELAEDNRIVNGINNFRILVGDESVAVRKSED